MMTKAIAKLMIPVLLLTPLGCKTAAGTGAIAGTVGGAAIGAAVDHKNPGRGALIGAAAGLVVGTVVGAVVDAEEKKTAEEAARRDRVVVREVYDEKTDETYRVRSDPAPRDPNVPTTRVTTTVTKWNPDTRQWEQVSQSNQEVPNN